MIGRITIFLIFFLFFMTFQACGVKGPPLPPLQTAPELQDKSLLDSSKDSEKKKKIVLTEPIPPFTLPTKE